MNRKQEPLESLPVAALLAAVNNSLQLLRKKGISVSDWDQKKRALYGLKVFGGRVYFLATEPDKSGQKGKTCGGQGGNGGQKK